MLRRVDAAAAAHHLKAAGTQGRPWISQDLPGPPWRRRLDLCARLFERASFRGGPRHAGGGGARGSSFASGGVRRRRQPGGGRGGGEARGRQHDERGAIVLQRGSSSVATAPLPAVAATRRGLPRLATLHDSHAY